MGGEPREGVPFLALNHDREVWVAKWLPAPANRMAFRTNRLWETSSHEIVTLPDGREAKVEQWAKEQWASDWTLWTRRYEFNPTHWMPLPEPPDEVA
jgi:hypothetical protein